MENNIQLSYVIKNDLCRQYAENENHRQTIIIAFLSVLIAAIAGYGLALKELLINEVTFNKFTLFFLAAILAIFLFTIPIVFAIILGYNLRRDQLIVDKIRRITFKDEYNELFKAYNPIKSKCNYLQDFNLAIVWFSVIFQIVSAIVFCLFACYFSTHNLINNFTCCIYSFVIILFLLIMLGVNFFVFYCYSNKYERKKIYQTAEAEKLGESRQ